MKGSKVAAAAGVMIFGVNCAARSKGDEGVVGSCFGDNLSKCSLSGDGLADSSGCFLFLSPFWCVEKNKTMMKLIGGGRENREEY